MPDGGKLAINVENQKLMIIVVKIVMTTMASKGFSEYLDFMDISFTSTKQKPAIQGKWTVSLARPERALLARLLLWPAVAG